MNAQEFAETLKRAVEFMYQQQAEIAELKNARDYWCLQYKDVINKLETKCNGK
jgi:hypothetical protein